MVMHKSAIFTMTDIELSPPDQWGNRNSIFQNLSASFFTIEEAIRQAHEMYATGAYESVILSSKNTRHNQNTWNYKISSHGVEMYGNTFLYYAERSAEDSAYIFNGYEGEYAEQDQAMLPATHGERFPYTIEDCTLRRNKFGFQS